MISKIILTNPKWIKIINNWIMNFLNLNKAKMLNKRTLSKKIYSIINSPEKYDGKDVLVTNGIIL